MIRKFKLELPNYVYDLSNNIKGNWTMVYDEGFEINIGSENFFAFSKY